jgi:hypothetical protein
MQGIGEGFAFQELINKWSLDKLDVIPEGG